MKTAPITFVTMVLLGVLFAANCYRAATQSITHDEALTWQFYLSGPASDIFEHYDANHHFLATILVRLSTTLFGTSELSMRLPTLLAGALYFHSIFHLSRLVFGARPMMFGLTLVACAHPYVLDFLVAARGYGLALALLAWSLFRSVAYLTSPASAGRKCLYQAGASLALSVAANLAFLFPALALLSLVAWQLGREPQAADRTARKRKNKAASGAPHYVAAAVAVGVLFFLTAPFPASELSHFYFGAESLHEALHSLTEVSFAYGSGPGGILAASGLQAVLLHVVPVAAPLVVLAAFLMALLRPAGGQDGAADRLAVLTGGTVIGTLLFSIGVHYLLGLPYPEDRTAIFVVPLAGCCLAVLADRLRAAARARGLLLSAIPVLCGAYFLLEWNTSSFLTWRYDADSRRLMDRLETVAQPRAVPIRVGASWQLEPSLNFYRTVRRLEWMLPVRRAGLGEEMDFYVLLPQDQHLIRDRGLREIDRGKISKTVLAVAGG